MDTHDGLLYSSIGAKSFSMTNLAQYAKFRTRKNAFCRDLSFFKTLFSLYLPGMWHIMYVSTDILSSNLINGINVITIYTDIIQTYTTCKSTGA